MPYTRIIYHIIQTETNLYEHKIKIAGLIHAYKHAAHIYVHSFT